MTDTPWSGDACSLVDAFRSGVRRPLEEVDAALAAIESSSLNAFCHLDGDRAREVASKANVSLPFGGVPIGVKELDRVEGWPAADASLAFQGRVATYTSTCVERLIGRGGAIAVGQTTSSEFGGLNVSVSRLHGVTANVWDAGRTAGGSSAGSAAAVAGGLVTLATGSDGGGSIRIPAGFGGLVGLKTTYGRVPRGPRSEISPMTVTHGVLARSVRDVARHLDVAEGPDRRDPYSLPAVGRWEERLGWRGDVLKGARVAIVPDLGTAVVTPEVAAIVTEAGEALARSAGWKRVVVATPPAGLVNEWALANLVTLVAELHTLGDSWQDHLPELTLELQFGLAVGRASYDIDSAARIEVARTGINEAMAAMFEAADIVVCATNPDVAFPAEVTLNNRVGDRRVGPENGGALTIPSNLYGNPAISLPAGNLDGLPVGVQLLAPHHREDLLLEAALLWERLRPWPRTAPGSPR